MIKGIYLDNDESLSHCVLREPNQKHLRFALEDGGIYYPIIRPCAKRIIDYCRNLVGAENVRILTTATKEYIRGVNEVAEWGFEDEQLIAREEISNHHFATAYGGNCTLPSKYAHRDNVLIDNLDPRNNPDKISFLGIWKTVDTNYLKVRDYYGVDFPSDLFEEKVLQFLEERHSAPSQCKQISEEENLEI